MDKYAQADTEGSGTQVCYSCNFQGRPDNTKCLFLTLAQLPLAQGLWLACGKNAKTYFVAVASVKLPHQGRFYHWIKIFYPVIQQYEITCVLIINMINWNMGKIIIVKINYLSVYNYRAVYNPAKKHFTRRKKTVYGTLMKYGTPDTNAAHSQNKFLRRGFVFCAMYGWFHCTFQEIECL